MLTTSPKTYDKKRCTLVFKKHKASCLFEPGLHNALHQLAGLSSTDVTLVRDSEYGVPTPYEVNTQ